MRRTPVNTRNRAAGQASPSNRGTTTQNSSHGRRTNRTGAQTVPPILPQDPAGPPPSANQGPTGSADTIGDRSPTISIGRLPNESSPFASGEQTIWNDGADPFISTPDNVRYPAPNPPLAQRVFQPQPRRVPPISFDDFIGERHAGHGLALSEVQLRLQLLDKIAPTVKSFTRSMAKLDSDGTNFGSWLGEANATIYFLIGKMNYLDSPSNPHNQIDVDIDHAENTIAYCVVYYSVEPDLRTVLRREQHSFLAHDAYLVLSGQFNKAGRSSQLATWRSMSSAKMDIFRTPLSQHVEMLDRFADALDRDGFSWTRDSVMSIVYQASMPDGPDLNCDAANTTLDLRWSYDKRPYSCAEVKAALQTTIINLKRHQNMDDLTNGISVMALAASDSVCHYCNESGHWKYNCPKRRVTFAPPATISTQRNPSGIQQPYSSANSRHAAPPARPSTTLPQRSVAKEVQQAPKKTPAQSAHAVYLDSGYEEYPRYPDGIYAGNFSAEQGFIPHSAMSLEFGDLEVLEKDEEEVKGSEIPEEYFILISSFFF